MRAQAFAHREYLGQHRELADDRFQADRHQFEDLIPDASRAAAGRQRVATRLAPTPFRATSRAASIGTFMAINGDGFFVVEKPPSVFDGASRFSAASISTRGAATSSSMPERLSGQRRRLLPDGIPIDPTTGNPVGSVAAAAAIPERLPAGERHQHHFVRAQPADRSGDDGSTARRFRIPNCSRLGFQRRPRSDDCRHRDR